MDLKQELRRLDRKETKLIAMLTSLRQQRKLLGVPHHPVSDEEKVLSFIRLNPGLTRDEIILKGDISSAALTSLMKQGMIYTTEVENRLRRYYIR